MSPSVIHTDLKCVISKPTHYFLPKLFPLFMINITMIHF